MNDDSSCQREIPRQASFSSVRGMSPAGLPARPQGRKLLVAAIRRSLAALFAC